MRSEISRTRRVSEPTPGKRVEAAKEPLPDQALDQQTPRELESDALELTDEAIEASEKEGKKPVASLGKESPKDESGQKIDEVA